MSLIIHLKIIGIALMLLALVHFVLPKWCEWREELARLSLLNRQLMQVHTFFIALIVLLFGVLTFFFTDELLSKSRLAQVILVGFTIFWAIRLVFQFFVYDAELWRGKRLETIVHILFACFWTYCTIVYGGAYWWGYAH
jgi:FtsH-binding integral membrane protein